MDEFKLLVTLEFEFEFGDDTFLIAFFSTMLNIHSLSEAPKSFV